MLNNIFLGILILSSSLIFSQNEKSLEGKIIVNNAKKSGIRIINLVNQKEAISDAEGNFSILAKPDDLLVFSAEFLDYMRKIVQEADYKKGSFNVEMTSKIEQLDEVEIREFNKINAVSLGILSRPAKKFTPAERRLNAASNLYPSVYAGTMAGGSLGLDPLINWISGRTKMLKRALKSEDKEILLQQLDYNYNDSFFVDDLQIESLYLNGFKNYVVYDAALIEAIQSKNKALMDFNLIRLATEFKNLNEYER